MTIKTKLQQRTCALLIGFSAVLFTVPANSAEVNGFVEAAYYSREDVDLSKARHTLQLEFSTEKKQTSPFTFHATLRGTYDAVYDWNESEYGDRAGGPIILESIGGTDAAHGAGIALPFGSIDLTTNPNDGMIVLGSRLHEPGGGVTFGVPVRPCDADSRGCIKDYLDFDGDELRFPEFNDHLDFIREAYVDAEFPISGSDDILNIRLGKQQVVWGRSDLFRVLDVVNPVDFSRNNIYDELEDIRIPQWILNMEYRMGGTGVFDDLNFAVVWNFDEFRPAALGQGGTPNSILDAGYFFRGMKNCWDNGCTVSNFAGGVLATDFGPGVIGIRQANVPDWEFKNTQGGVKLEGVYKGVGFSLNYLHYRSQLPSLRGGIEANSPFDGSTGVFPYLIAFDIDFPEVDLIGGSLDFYVDSIASVFRVEAAYTQGEEFANTLQPRLFSDSDVVRYVIGWDRSTFIPFLNKTRAFLFSGQLFGQHLLDHEKEDGVLGPVGMPDWEDNWIATLLIKGWYKSDRVSPQIIFAHDFGADATVIAPSVDWLINDNWRLVIAGNFKTGSAKTFDDCRACNPFPPFTAGPGQTEPGSLGLGGFEPLGRFRQGPIGSAANEDEIQITLRYRF